MEATGSQAGALGQEVGDGLPQVRRRCGPGPGSGLRRGGRVGGACVEGGRVKGGGASGVSPGVDVDQEGQAVAGGQDDDPAQRGHGRHEGRPQPGGHRAQPGDNVEARESVVGGEKMSSHSERY